MQTKSLVDLLQLQPFGAIVVLVGFATFVASFLPEGAPLKMGGIEIPSLPPHIRRKVRWGAAAVFVAGVSMHVPLLPASTEPAPADSLPSRTPSPGEVAPQTSPAGQRISVRFTSVPEIAVGTAGVLKGRVEGLAAPEQYRIVVYAQQDKWFVQPSIEQPLTAIDRDGSWSSWTHDGKSYAALVVKASYLPPHVTEFLPTGEAAVVASAVSHSAEAKDRGEQR